jgi:hypothetical protein
MEQQMEFNFEISMKKYGILYDVCRLRPLVPCTPVFIKEYIVLLAMLRRASMFRSFSFNSARNCNVCYP